jgi:RNA polymerase sigma-70 factor (ECF subfamily)
MDSLDGLLADAKGGDRVAADRLFAEYRPLLHLIARQNLGAETRRREDSSDAVQLTELEAYRSLNTFRGTTLAEFTAWLKQILRRNVANLVRDHRAGKRDLRRELFLDDPDGSSALSWRHPVARQASPSCMMMTTEAALALARAMDDLPESQRQAVQLRHIEGRSLDEIAEALGKTAPAVAGLLRRGLQTLRAQMQGETSWA